MLLCFHATTNACAWEKKVKEVRKLQQLKYIYQHTVKFIHIRLAPKVQTLFKKLFNSMIN